MIVLNCFLKVHGCFYPQLKEFEEALARRDEVIGVLSSNLRKVTENRDTLQVEYTGQANQLMQQVHLLQQQLKQVSKIHLIVHI